MNERFNGFKAGKPQIIPLHGQFFTDVLPLVDDLAELKVILHCYRALMQKEGDYRYLRHDDFLNDPDLQRGITADGDDFTAILNAALARAVDHEILLRYDLPLEDSDSDETRTIYFMNTERGRTALEHLKADEWRINWDERIEILPERPNIYRLYEENIGALTSGIAERLKHAEDDYPYHWIIEAINIAIDNNVRKWNYINSILDGWKQEGRHDEKSRRIAQSDERDYTGGEYADFIES